MLLAGLDIGNWNLLQSLEMSEAAAEEERRPDIRHLTTRIKMLSRPQPTQTVFFFRVSEIER